MSKRIFTKEQVEELSNNPHVASCREKTFSYKKEFKVLAVKRYEEEGLAASQIFKEAGFNLETVGRKTPNQRMSEWRKIHKAKGDKGLSEENRGKGKGGGRPKTKDVTDQDKIERLELTVAYLKAENAFLAKLRAARKE